MIAERLVSDASVITMKPEVCEWCIKLETCEWCICNFNETRTGDRCSKWSSDSGAKNW